MFTSSVITNEFPGKTLPLSRKQSTVLPSIFFAERFIVSPLKNLSESNVTFSFASTFAGALGTAFIEEK